MVEIPEYKRDESKDYLHVLRSLNEIPFPVGKNLLSDFLIGDTRNKSIQKNKLYNKINFGVMDFSNKPAILSLIQNLLGKGLIEETPAIFNRNIKTLSVSKRGQEELLTPSIKENEQSNEMDFETEITDNEIEKFKELQGFLGNLNLEQKKAVICPKKKILCIAGAGSGKTTVLAKRISSLTQLKNISSENILAITFTRKAKKQMQEKLKKLKVKGAHIETFNSFCEKVLLKNSEKIYGKKVRVASFQDKMVAVIAALDNLGITMDDAIEKYFTPSQIKNKNSYQLQATFVNDCFSALEYYKMTNKPLCEQETNLSGNISETAKMIFSVIKFVLEYMKINNLRTYSDQISHAIDFFKQNPKEIPNYEHILVDEYQDVNSQQVKLLKQLNPKNIFCVGDPRQSIFGWRGSDISFILNFAKREDVEVINLRKNYRSNSHIVNLMNESIKEMNLAPLESNINGKKNINLCKLSSDIKEYEFVSKKILLSDTRREDIFVLARTNKQLKDLSEYFEKNKINHVLRNDDLKEVEAKEGEVTLATIHSIKGLEAREVYIVGCTSKNFPCLATEHPIMEIVKMYDYNKLDEERRLFYVAISRAKEKLYMTYSGNNHTYFIKDEMKEFLDEIEY